jgi:ribose transport system substrate-binding protein
MFFHAQYWPKRAAGALLAGWPTSLPPRHTGVGSGMNTTYSVPNTYSLCKQSTVKDAAQKGATMFSRSFHREDMPPSRRNVRRGRVLTAAVAIGTLVLATGLNVGVSGASPRKSANTRHASTSPISSLPASVQQLYAHLTEPVIVSPYAHYTPPKPPWKICFEDAYEGNIWRISVRQQLSRLASLFEAKHLVSSFTYAVSNDTPTLENSQLRSFIDKRCTLILLTAGSSTGDNGSIAAAYHKGIVVVAFNNYVTSPYAQVVDQNWYLWGQEMAQQIAKDLHGHGTVIMVQGIAGETVAVAENLGANAVWSKYPGLTILRTYGNWTPSITSTAITKVLATHPGRIDAVWTTGSELWYVVQAFKQAGRPVPIITGSPEGDTLALAHADPSVASKLFGDAVLPVPIADYGFDTGIRILAGEHPKVSPILFPLSPWSGTNLTGWYGSCMTQAQVPPFPVPPTQPLTDAQMNSYFTNGHVVAPYSYKGTLPKTC